MAPWSIPLRLPDVAAMGLVATGLAVVFQRTRFTISSVRLDPPVDGARERLLFDRGVHVTWRAASRERELKLLVEIVGQPLVVQRRFLFVEDIDRERSVEGWTLLPQAQAEAALEVAANPATEIAQRRARLELDRSPLRPHRLFFLRLDEWTDLRTMGSPPPLPAPLQPVVGEDIVIEALEVLSLSNSLESWVKELELTGDQRDLTVGFDFTPTQWIKAMATYLKAVLEHAFEEQFFRPLTTSVPSGNGTRLVVDREFEVAFEEFANANLGDPTTVPLSNLGFPDGAYFFSFAAFAWLAKIKANSAGDRKFWRAIWPVWAYTAEIYRRRYTPAAAGGTYLQYKHTNPLNPASSAADIAALHVTSMTLAAFRNILQDACSS